MSKREYKNVHSETHRAPQREGKGRPLLGAGVLPPNHDGTSLPPNAEKLPHMEKPVFPISTFNS